MASYNLVPNAKVTVEMVDPEGEVTVTATHVPVTATSTVTVIAAAAQAIADAILACSNAALRSVSVSLDWLSDLALPTSTGKYDDSEDKLFIELASDVDGSTVRINLPLPADTDFLSDDETINPADANITALINALETNAVSTTGQPPTNLIKGYRRRAKTRRRLRQGIWTETGG